MSFRPESTGMLQVSVPVPFLEDTLYRESGAVPGAAFNINSSTSTKPRGFCLLDVALTAANRVYYHQAQPFPYPANFPLRL